MIGAFLRELPQVGRSVLISVDNKTTGGTIDSKDPQRIDIKTGEREEEIVYGLTSFFPLRSLADSIAQANTCLLGCREWPALSPRCDLPRRYHSPYAGPRRTRHGHDQQPDHQPAKLCRLYKSCHRSLLLRRRSRQRSCLTCTHFLNLCSLVPLHYSPLRFGV